jgi:hypothetical protein
MSRARALKVVLVVVVLIFFGLVYPLTMFVRQEPALAMMPQCLSPPSPMASCVGSKAIPPPC